MTAVGDHAGYYAVIPAPVLYDQQLAPRAKLLYAVVSNFCNYYGYCTVHNAVFARYFGCSEGTVERLLKSLRDGSYIRQDIVNDGGKTVRRIWLDAEANRPPKNEGSPGDRPLKNEGALRSNNNKKDPPTVPQGGRKKTGKRKRPTGTVELPPELEESFARFWDAYPKKEDKQNARLRWSQLEPDEALVQTILRAVALQKLSEKWLDGYIPMPSTWLNNRRWEDEPAPAQTPEDDGRYW